ncbi:hypothetical protein F0562_012770 [Nyssa sinensis]|uniref:Retrotransposon gag domain-containing protein n=1 Tax=Nyssa sinensis TaxID=561372 RepID=A0A5J4ZVV6_9ASTE|nr:hypothetical protein F0562_012770 [Nyssa sinensis]
MKFFRSSVMDGCSDISLKFVLTLENADVSRSCKPSSQMTTNKERIENLEVGFGAVQDGLHQMEIGMADNLHHLEETLNRLSDVLLTSRESSNLGNQDREGHNRFREENDGGRQPFSYKTARLDFPRFLGDDLTEWFNRVNQFFEYQGTVEAQKVPMVAYHLEGEANQWWQWIRRTFREEGRVLSWETFEDEL